MKFSAYHVFGIVVDELSESTLEVCANLVEPLLLFLRDLFLNYSLVSLVDFVSQALLDFLVFIRWVTDVWALRAMVGSMNLLPEKALVTKCKT